MNALFATLGAISTWSDLVLRKAHLVRLFDPVTRTHAVMPSMTYGRLYAGCLSILDRHEGYVFAEDLNRMRGFMARQNVISEQDLARVVGRATELRAAGIPPAFREEWYTKARFRYFMTGPKPNMATDVSHFSLFPTLDFIIQYGAGVYEQRCTAVAAKLTAGGVRRSKLYMTPATADDVKRFRAVAFMPDGRIDPMLLAEILLYVSEHFTFRTEERRQEILELDELAFVYLEDVLRPLSFDPVPYETWDGNPSTAGERRWYLRFAPERREEIARAYLADRKRNPKKAKEMDAVRVLRRSFPDLCEEMEERKLERAWTEVFSRVSETLEVRFRTGMFSDLPGSIFVDEQWTSVFGERFERAFRDACRKLTAADFSGLFVDADTLGSRLEFPRRLPYVQPFKRYLNEERLAMAMEMTDAQFLSLFGGTKGTALRAAIGHTKFGEETPDAIALRVCLNTIHRHLTE